MAIVVRLDVMLALRKVRSKELAADIGITEPNLSLLKSGKVKGIRFSTLEAIWEAAHGAAEDVAAGHACYVHLADTVRAIAEDAAEALADLPIAFAPADES